MAGFENDVMLGKNLNFDPVAPKPHLGIINAAGKIPIGTGNVQPIPEILGGSITSPDGSLTIGYSSPNITIVANSGVVGETITGNTGGPLSPTAGNWNILGTSTNGIQTSGSGSTLTTRMQSPYADGNFSFESQAGGVTRTLTVQNTVDAASSQATQLISVAGATSGDVWTQYSIGSAQSYAIGIDNSDSDILKITQAASGTVNPSTATVLQQFDSSNNRVYFPIPLAALGGSFAAVNVNQVILNSNTTAGSDASLSLQVSAEGGGGNSYVAYTGPSYNWSNGVNKTGASGAWQVRNGGSMTAGSAVVSITTAGEVTFPLTPAFSAYITASEANITGDGTIATVGAVSGFTEIFDQNSDFSGTTFTAPVTGRYRLGAFARGSGYIAQTATVFQISTSNRAYSLYWGSPATMRDAQNRVSNIIDVLADMDAADTAVLTIQSSNSTKTTGVDFGSAGNPLTMFYGQLEC